MIKVKWDQLYANSGDSTGSAVDGSAFARPLSAHTPPLARSQRRRPPPPPVPVIGGVSSHNKLTSPVIMFGGNGSYGVIPEMDTICETSAPATYASEWSYDKFRLNSKGQVTCRETKQKITKDEMREHGEGILRGLIEHVHSKMLREFQFVEQAIPALDDAMGNGSSATSMGSSYASSSVNSGAAAHSVRSSSSSICSTADGFRTMIDSDVPRCIFHTSENYRIAEKLLVFVCSSRGLSCGIWSRSLLLQEGVQVGSMVPYFRKALEAGFGILVMNPNMNTQTMIDLDGVERKLPIQGSSTQEEHCDHVWQQYIFPSSAHKIHFIAYGYGGVLVANLIEKYRYELKNRLGNVAYIESTHKVDQSKWSDGFQRFFSQHSICWKRSSEPLNVEIGQGGNGGAMALDKYPVIDEDNASPVSSSSGRGKHSLAAVDTSVFGCLCLSAGPETTVSSSPAYTTKDTLKTVFKFLAAPNAYEFHRLIVREVRMRALRAASNGGRADGGAVEDQGLARTMHGLALGDGNLQSSFRGAASGHGGGRLGNSRRNSSSTKGSHASLQPPHNPPPKETVTVDDFQLLRVVGRGAFGKVMLVRKKKPKKPIFASSMAMSSVSSYRGDSGRHRSNSRHGLAGSSSTTTSSTSTTSGGSSNTSSTADGGGGGIFAMKVIKKAAVFAKNQVEHTKTERRILEGIDHPFAVKLRYAFQTETKLFFVMDYYNGGTLHFHLRQARKFDEKRACFYAAQVVLALSHLHTYNVVYRDLKPENILMDDEGYIAVTDFGLSSDHYDAKGEGLKTFCGTPEYIAPELIRRQPYGKSVDYWSLGVMLYEMLAGYTPFHDSNRKRNFENIVKMPLRFATDCFSENAKSILRGLLRRDPAKRLGSGPTGANEIMDHPFFAHVDWEKLYKRDFHVPFKPMVKKDGELTNIPEFFKRQDVLDSAPDMPAPIGTKNEFMGFTYVDPLPMS